MQQRVAATDCHTPGPSAALVNTSLYLLYLCPMSHALSHSPPFESRIVSCDLLDIKDTVVCSFTEMAARITEDDHRDLSIPWDARQVNRAARVCARVPSDYTAARNVFTRRPWPGVTSDCRRHGRWHQTAAATRIIISAVILLLRRSSVSYCASQFQGRAFLFFVHPAIIVVLLLTTTHLQRHPAFTSLYCTGLVGGGSLCNQVESCACRLLYDCASNAQL